MTPDSIYGAGSSLRQHMELMADQEVSILLPVHRKIKSPANGLRVFKFFCPITYNNDERHGFVRRIILSGGSRLAFWLSSPLVFFRLMRIKPDVVHLNSLVLSDFLLLLGLYKVFRKVAVVSHVREMLSFEMSAYQKWLVSVCDHLVFIDHAVEKRFHEVVGAPKASDVVQNPFSGASADYKLPTSLQFLKSESRIVYAIAGRIEDGKGVLEICQEFARSQLRNSLLVIVGGGSEPYVQKIKEAESDSNGCVRYVGQIDNLQASGFFSEIDFLVRGEPFFCTGRTVYEALYSGASVVLPGSERNLEMDTVLADFKEYVEFYEPRDFSRMIELVRENEDRNMKGSSRISHCNYEDYSKAIASIYSKVVE
ncbi:glycosyltransferase family 4 protein [Pseudomonas sp. LFM046]|uniref:glycosyltransferase family 4 protein n=1 Tax=Pseudomonas sp. LFM046 TaxID=1608357 RepID=UPI0011AEE7BB|nr:glycosyltransferase family 4 protein [Pseudomonas sp. LFM046]